MLRGIVDALNTEFRSLEPGGPRGTEALAAALSVSLAVLAALLLHSDEPWWAAISAWMVTRSSLAVSLSRGAMRIIGSAVGAAIAVIVFTGHPRDGEMLPCCEETGRRKTPVGRLPIGLAVDMVSDTGSIKDGRMLRA